MRTDEGILNFSWFDLAFNGQDFANGDRLFTLCFTAVGTGNGELRFSDNETPMTINQYDANLEQDEISDLLGFDSQNFSVVDNQNPTVTNCPTDIVVFTTADNCQAIGNWSEPIFADACSAVTPQQTHFVGDVFGVGNRTVQYTGVDAAGNIATCSFVVSVRDTIAPTVMNCPNSITRNISAANNCDARVTWVSPTATDLCTDTPIGTPNFQSGDAFPMGETIVRYAFICLLYTSPSPRDKRQSRMPSSA